MKKPELLAPAGNMESLIAAIEAGCDAVYLSGKKYGARTYANNFTDEELIEAINYSHIYGVKVYVTVNTIIYEHEVEDFVKYIEFLHKNNVDAVIMQDIGMIDLIRKTFPNLEIHISTQMNIHNKEGVKLFEQMGIKRVVLARETNIETIKQIKQTTNVEIEVFIHGALCISYSGQCLMSSLIGGRSGNRGACAGCCRLPYELIEENKTINKDKYILSTKDLMTLEKIDELIESGIESFKIEGRMKRPEYVYQIVSLYRKAIDTYLKTKKVEINNKDIIEMKKIFNREFTKGYLFNEKNITNPKRPNHAGIEIGKVEQYKNGKAYIKLTEDLNINDGIRIIGNPDIGQIITKIKINDKDIEHAKKGQTINIKCEKVKTNSIVVKTTDAEQIKNIKEKIKQKTRKVLIKGTIKLNKGKKIILEIQDEKNKIIGTGNIVEKAIKNPTTKDQIEKQINRLGGTIFEFEKLDIIMDNDIFIPVSVLNEIRRKALEQLLEKRKYKIEYKKENYKIELPDFKKTQEKSCLISNIEQYKKIKEQYNYIYIDDKETYKQTTNTIYKLPRINETYEDTKQRLLVSDIGSLYKYKNIDTDFPFNVVNSYSVAFLHSLGVKKITLSYELDLLKTKEIRDIDKEARAYKKKGDERNGKLFQIMWL